MWTDIEFIIYLYYLNLNSWYYLALYIDSNDNYMTL